MQEFICLFQLDATQVGQGGALGLLNVIEQHAGGGRRRVQAFQSKTGQVGSFKLFAQQGSALLVIKFPGWALPGALRVDER